MIDILTIALLIVVIACVIGLAIIAWAATETEEAVGPDRPEPPPAIYSPLDEDPRA